MSKDRRDNPYDFIRIPIHAPGGPMKTKKDYKRSKAKKEMKQDILDWISEYEKEEEND